MAICNDIASTKISPLAGLGKGETASSCYYDISADGAEKRLGVPCYKDVAPDGAISLKRGVTEIVHDCINQNWPAPKPRRSKLARPQNHGEANSPAHNRREVNSPAQNH